MFARLFEKELKLVLLSPKFVATFGVSSILIILSVFIGVQDYKASVRQYESAGQLADQELREATSWFGLGNTVHRRPDVMQIFAAGVNNDIGRLSSISTWNDIKLRQSNYLDNSLFALFRFIDFTFIFQVVLSLFAILFTYDAINGERESGTLRLTYSCPVPRATYLLAKLAGAWTGLVVPLLIPVALAILLVLVMNVPVDSTHWYRILALLGVAVLYFTVFITLGLFVSAMTRSSRVSFLVLLVFWVTSVLIVPRGATMAAGQMVQVPSVAEVESMKDRYFADRRTTFFGEMSELWRERSTGTEDMSKQERDQFREDNEDRWKEDEAALRQAMEDDVANYGRMVGEDLQNRKRERERLAFLLARAAPPAAFQIAALNIAGTNVTLKTRYEESMKAYRSSFAQFVEVKRAEEREERTRSQQGGGIIRMLRAGGGTPIDASGMPRFEPPDQILADAISPSLIDLALLAFYSVAFFAGAFVAFLRYDVR